LTVAPGVLDFREGGLFEPSGSVPIRSQMPWCRYRRFSAEERQTPEASNGLNELDWTNTSIRLALVGFLDPTEGWGGYTDAWIQEQLEAGTGSK
jgi:hypothetical protein